MSLRTLFSVLLGDRRINSTDFVAEKLWGGVIDGLGRRQ
jgi:hypothetical protein